MTVNGLEHWGMQLEKEAKVIGQSYDTFWSTVHNHDHSGYVPCKSAYDEVIKWDSDPNYRATYRVYLEILQHAIELYRMTSD